jgi:hypothetical protein
MLSDIKFERKVISAYGQSFSVRGVGLDIISKLLTGGSRTEIDAVVADFSRAVKSDEAGDDAGVESSLMNFATKLPALAARLIAMCADEPDAVEVVEKLPLAVQTEALLAIFWLTFDGEESLKNFVSGLKKLLSSMTKAVEAAGQTAVTGTKA